MYTCIDGMLVCERIAKDTALESGTRHSTTRWTMLFSAYLCEIELFHLCCSKRKTAEHVYDPTFQGGKILVQYIYIYISYYVIIVQFKCRYTSRYTYIHITLWYIYIHIMMCVYIYMRYDIYIYTVHTVIHSKMKTLQRTNPQSWEVPELMLEATKGGWGLPITNVPWGWWFPASLMFPVRFPNLPKRNP